jgi:catechol 2,3-dioxygenase-like lactoylglutathione lyase family enzyme
MSVSLNHTIVAAHDKRASAQFLADILGITVGGEFGPFVPVPLANGVTLDYMTQRDIRPQHYAFLVADEEFDAAFARIQAAGLPYWADPEHLVPTQLNHRFGGRGLYFDDPNGHQLEIFTRTP